MAVPRVFISSTYYDLRHIRASLDQFVRSLGFDSVLSEKGDIAYEFDRALDESCYREVGSSDMLVLVVGGRAGAAVSDAASSLDEGAEEFYRRYDSITRREYETAAERDIPVFILVDEAVYAEFQTYKLNRDNESIAYTSVDSVNVFRLLDHILTRPRNNPVHSFARFAEIEEWLRKQWAGQFGEMLRRSSESKKLADLSAQVAEMRDLNRTLKNYLEEVVSIVAPESSARIISTETDRLADSSARRKAMSLNSVTEMLAGDFGLDDDIAFDLLVMPETSQEFVDRLIAVVGPEADHLRDWASFAEFASGFEMSVNEMRDAVGRPKLVVVPIDRPANLRDGDHKPVIAVSEERSEA